MNVKEKFNLKGALTVITGGAGLLGEKHAEAILEGGGRVILLDINEKCLFEKIKILEAQYNQKIWGYQLDVTKPDSIKYICQKITKEVGIVDILINNVTNNPDVKKGNEDLTRFENIPLKRWNEDFAVAVTSAFLLCQQLCPIMVEKKKGVVLNVASDLAIIAPDQRIYKQEGMPESQQPVKPVTYSVVKHALIGLTKYLATYWADKGIRVNAISPGGVWGKELTEEFVKRISHLIPMARMANYNEYKAAILFLCSDASSYVTGTNLIIDGGRTCW